jgi:uncharacterized protein
VDVDLPRPRRIVLRNEVLLVLGVSLGMSAVYAILYLYQDLTKRVPLSQQTAALNTSRAPGRPGLDLVLQLTDVFFALVPALLAVHLLRRDRPDALSALGLDRRRIGFDAGWAALLAAVIGIPGLGLYFVARELGVNTQVAAANLPHVWWAVPVLILDAAQNGILEEVVVVGYLLTRLRDLTWSPRSAIAASALLRGSYHLYQGFGGFIGNALMGVVFGVYFHRTRRLLPLVVAHTILDIVSFVGYALLRDRWSLLR